MGNVPEIASGIKYSSIWPRLSAKTPAKIQTDLMVLPCKSEGGFAIKFSLNKIWHTIKREQKERSAPLSNCALEEHVVCEMSQSALVHAGSPGGCAGCRGCPGDRTASACSLVAQAQPRHNQNRSLGCKPGKNSSCQPRCWHHLRRGTVPHRRRVPLPRLLSIFSAARAWKVLAPSRKHSVFSSCRLPESASSKERKCKSFTA